MDKEIIDVMQLIISKLIRMSKWGGAHTEFRNLSKGLPSHYTSSKKGKKKIDKAIKELIKKDFILTKPSIGELHVSPNPRKTNEILQFYEKYKK